MKFSIFGTTQQRISFAINSLKKGKGVIVIDNKKRENECDILFVAEKMTLQQMIFTIRHGSGIVCLCLTQKHCKKLKLPMMVKHNTSKWGTGFTVSIEAAKGITTGVSASDRLKTIKTAISNKVIPSDLHHPGHVFPLCAHPKGIFMRDGHTEAAIELIKLAGYSNPFGVICEITNDNGTMTRDDEIIIFAKTFNIPIVTIEDLIFFLKK